MWAGFGRQRQNVAWSRSTVGLFQPKLGRCRPTPGRSRSDLARASPRPPPHRPRTGEFSTGSGPVSTNPWRFRGNRCRHLGSSVQRLFECVALRRRTWTGVRPRPARRTEPESSAQPAPSASRSGDSATAASAAPRPGAAAGAWRTATTVTPSATEKGKRSKILAIIFILFLPASTPTTPSTTSTSTSPTTTTSRSSLSLMALAQIADPPTIATSTQVQAQCSSVALAHPRLAHHSTSPPPSSTSSRMAAPTALNIAKDDMEDKGTHVHMDVKRVGLQIFVGDLHSLGAVLPTSTISAWTSATRTWPRRRRTPSAAATARAPQARAPAVGLEC